MKKDTNLFLKYVEPSVIGMLIGGSFSIADTIFIGQASGKNVHNSQALRYGAVDALAAYTVLSALESPGSMLMREIAAGGQPLSANMYGRESTSVRTDSATTGTGQLSLRESC